MTDYIIIKIADEQNHAECDHCGYSVEYEKPDPD
jgi:hypothetical protein